jgi:methionine synthase II (cobalamin-independent)
MSPHSVTKHPYCAEHVGSILRPDYLAKQREAIGPYTYSSPDLKEHEDEAVKYAVQLQKDVDIGILTDGEMRRRYFYDGVFEKLDGMEKVVRPMTDFKVSAATLCNPSGVD